jgi:hypothetical protein
MATDLKTLIPNTFESITNESDLVRDAPEWTLDPHSVTATTTSITIGMQANTNGQICCIAILNQATKNSTAEQVYLGFDAYNAAAPAASCIPSNSTIA